MLDKLKIAAYRFALEARESLRLPLYKGSTLRGGFGHVFKRTVCFQRGAKTCTGCLLREKCAYAYLFETAPPPDSDVLRKNEAVPLPFVIEPPLDRRTEYKPGARLDFGLLLVGKAVEYLPYFIVVFDELGKVGIGIGRGKYALREVAARQPLSGAEAVVYDGTEVVGDGEALIADWAAVTEAAMSLRADGVKVNFLTPTRLKHGGQYVECPDFHVLVRAILRRVSSLYYFHCGQRWETDYRGLIEQAKGIETAAAHTSWMDWKRYSKRQRQRMNLGGFVGQVSYRGDLEPFLSLLVLGQLVHVGKACVFGNGWYEIGQSACEHRQKWPYPP
jgi:hypothetical protein